jgi:hypothetical protein
LIVAGAVKVAPFAGLLIAALGDAFGSRPSPCVAERAGRVRAGRVNSIPARATKLSSKYGELVRGG